EMSAMTTAAPCAPKRTAVARPIPLPAPVTIATLPVKSMGPPLSSALGVCRVGRRRSVPAGVLGGGPAGPVLRVVTGRHNRHAQADALRRQDFPPLANQLSIRLTDGPDV